MKYLFLSADYLAPVLRDESSEDSDIESQNLSAELIREIHEWNKSYQLVVPLSEAERIQRSSKIEWLDEWGIALAQRISAELAPAKVAYISEGLGRPLHY